MRPLKKSLFAVIARSGSDVAIYKSLIYIKTRLLRFTRNDNFVEFFSSLKLIKEGVYFVTRQKSNADFEVVENRDVPLNRNILKDQIIELKGYTS